MDRLTLNVGVRYDYFLNSYPEQGVGPAPLAPNRNVTFAAQDGWPLHDLSPRLGAVYDVTGEGRTAIKVSLNRYVARHGAGCELRPVRQLEPQFDPDVQTVLE